MLILLSLNDRPHCANMSKCSLDCITSILCHNKYLQDQALSTIFSNNSPSTIPKVHTFL